MYTLLFDTTATRHFIHKINEYIIILYKNINYVNANKSI